MQGDGTQGNPYIVTTWEEFIAAVKTSGAYVEQGNDIDMNEDLPTGLKDEVPFHCAEFNGSKYEIRNLYVIENGRFSLNSSSVRKLKLINFFYNGGTSSYTNGMLNFGNNANVFDLELSGFVADGKMAASGSACSVIGLSANIEGNGDIFRGGTSGSYAFAIENGNIRISGGGSLYSVCLTNCYITGDISQIYATKKRSPSIDSSVCIIDATIYQSISSYYNKVSLCFVNSDKVSEESTVASEFTLITDSQMHDADYLRSQGFPIGVD